jgi:hypothetical protein
MEQFIEPTPATRRKVLIVLCAGVVIAGILQFWAAPAFFSFVGSLPLCERFRWLQGAMIALLGTVALFGAWAAWYARGVLKSGQWPPAGAWVWRRTAIRRGRSAKWRAYALLALACMAMSVPLIGWHFLGQAGMLSRPVTMCSDGMVKSTFTTATNMTAKGASRRSEAGALRIPSGGR